MDERYIDLANYELEKAKRDFKAAKDNFSILHDYDTAVNRSYYAMFHLMSAAVALKGLQYSRHIGLIIGFQKEFIATGIVDKTLSKYINWNEELRHSADYKKLEKLSNPITKEEVELSLIKTKEFFDKIEPVILKLKEQIQQEENTKS